MDNIPWWRVLHRSCLGGILLWTCLSAAVSFAASGTDSCWCWLRVPEASFGTAGAASADVVTVQGTAAMTALKVDGTGGSFPITGSITNAGFNVTGSLPTGANVIGQVQSVPKTACGTTAFTPAWQAVPTAVTALTAVTSCVQAIIVMAAIRTLRLRRSRSPTDKGRR
jgi:hypothetical protein